MKVAEEKQEETLQAVVLADSFETRFVPFTLERPRCLLPLANVPLIEYTLEYLALAGARDVFIYAGSHTDQVENYVEASTWKAPSSPFKKLVFLKAQSASIGDVMRDLDSKHLITGDFLAVSGDVVCNFPIEDALIKHRRRRLKDKNAIMTILLREIDTLTKNGQHRQLPIFVINPTNDRCIHYQEPHSGRGAEISAESQYLSSHDEIDLRQDLADCRIDICTPDVLSLWSDNFDNQTPRKDFLFGVLKDYELNGKTIHTHIIQDHYACRVGDLRAYVSVSKDITSRWAFPLNPDINLLPQSTYQLRNGAVYQERGVVLVRSCSVGPGSILGQGTSIGDHTVIKNSIIGRRCLIGRKVMIENAYIWDDAVIGDGSKVEGCIIANEAVVGEKCHVQDGSLISFGVRLGPGTMVEAGSRLTTTPREPDDESVVGNGGHGHTYREDDDGQEDQPGVSTLLYKHPEAASSASSFSSTLSEMTGSQRRGHDSRSQSFTTIDDQDTSDRFQSEAVASLFERMQRNTEPEDVRVELMGLRFSNNATEHQVRRAVAVALMKHIQDVLETKTSAIDAAVREVLKKYKTLIQRDNENEDMENQVEFMMLVQRDLVRRKDGERILVFLARQLYNDDIFDEEVFEDWWNDPRSSADEDLVAVRASTQEFINWLANAEEEESESGSE